MAPVIIAALLLGISTKATAEVNVSAVSVITSKPAIPVALWSNACGANGSQVNDVIIKMQHPDQKSEGGENSCWTTFLDCSSGAPDIKAGFQAAESCSGGAINGEIIITTPICQNRGQVNTVMKAAEQFFLNDYPDQWWLIPVIGGGGNCDPTNPTQITNWAKIYPKEIVRTGNPKYIKADVICDPTLPQQHDVSLCLSHRLVWEKAKNM